MKLMNPNPMLLVTGREYLTGDMERAAVMQFGATPKGSQALRYVAFNLATLRAHFDYEGGADNILAFQIPMELAEEIASTAALAGRAGWSEETTAIHVWDPPVSAWVMVGRCRMR
jgi:hypothetical protein